MKANDDASYILMKKLSAFAAWLAATAFIGGFGGYFIVPQLAKFYKSNSNYQITQGTITAANPQTHNSCSIRFTVNDNEYNKEGVSCGDQAIGTHITVYFDPKNPELYANTNPLSLSLKELIPFALALIVFPLFFAYNAYKDKRSR